MLRTKLFRQAVMLFILILLLYGLAEVFYLHWEYWWYDVILHFLSGGLIGIVSVWFITSVFHKSPLSRNSLVVASLVGAIVIGSLWEVFELWANQTTFADGIYYYRDTISDLILDSCGGLFGTLYSFKQISKN